MIKVIELKFKKDITRLAGFPYGKETYEQQVAGEINVEKTEKLTLVFPESIEKIASSFVQGFFSDLVSTIGYEGIEKKIIVQTKSDSLKESIMRNLY